MFIFWIFGLIRKIVFLIVFASILILLFGSRCTVLTEGLPDYIPGLESQEDNRDLIDESLMAQFKQNMSTEFEVEESAVRVRRVEPTVWMDTCLGVPRSSGCENRLTPGFKVDVQIHDESHRIHLDQRGNFVFAPQ